MSTYSMNVTLENIRMLTMMILDIFIIWLILYYALRIIRNNSRTIQIFKGILFVVVIDGIAKVLGLKTLQYLADMFINWGFLVVIIIFQPEIRSILEKMGKSNVFSRITTLTGNEKESLVDNIVTAVMLLSKDQTGALVSIEQSHSLEDFIQTGTRMNSDVTAELLTSIFVTSTPLHDGAVIIQGDKIACASAYFPPTNLDLPSRYGARHRAAIGISEITDAVTIIVSEETGQVSITESGKIFHVNRKQLRDYLLRVICGETTEVENDAYASLHENQVEIHSEEDVQSGRRSVLNRLSIKKQQSQNTGKIETEEVRPAAEMPVENNDTATIETPFAAADAEAQAAEIKLPHKKKRPVPSYPEQVHTEVVSEEAPTVKRMTPEEVQAAREASRNRFRHARREMTPYDPERLDVPKIVGFKNELDEQFDMVDQLPSVKKEKQDEDVNNGGETDA